MIGKTNIGGKGGPPSRLILGAKNETITYRKTDSEIILGAVTLNEYGAGSITIQNGSYIFLGGKSQYQKTITIDKNVQTIYVRPVNSIYWYGVLLKTLVPYVENSITYNENSFNVGLGSASNWNLIDTEDSGEGYIEFTISYRGLWDAAGNYCRAVLTNGNSPNSPDASYIKNLSSPNTVEYQQATLTYEVVSGKTLRFGIYRQSTSYWLEITEIYKGTR